MTTASIQLLDMNGPKTRTDAVAHLHRGADEIECKIVFDSKRGVVVVLGALVCWCTDRQEK